MSPLLEFPLQARLVTPPATRRIPALLCYDRHDPLAVRAVFPAPPELEAPDTVWIFGRELLEVGLHAPAGIGDVHVRPCGPDRTAVELHAPEGMALIEFGTLELRRFLWRSYALVPQGQEHHNLGLDQDLTELLRRPLQG
ncbi:SsgA family sporulation/cell division regulator [Streptomyces sp. 549]|uniref:SsgA family sporulation/cell division regulator n=1 Tax=Streptomyces sp. 549 TaxID=3049076 RepID=UPI0024C27AF8|nr:SsgA family sporulation/cell division regulator [Streptomyces sp. 549]MDK1476030.1 SsgA family sporulation/cell division regulator [Streptomyces sp. 549]